MPAHAPHALEATTNLAFWLILSAVETQTVRAIYAVFQQPTDLTSEKETELQPSELPSA